MYSEDVRNRPTGSRKPDQIDENMSIYQNQNQKACIAHMTKHTDMYNKL